MGDEFDIYDLGGSRIGTAVPRGLELDSCLLGIAFSIALAFGLLLYLQVDLVARGILAALRGQWSKAMMFWALPGILATSFGFVLCFPIAAIPVSNHLWLEKRRVEHQQLEANFETQVSLLSAERKLGASPYVEFTIANYSDHWVRFTVTNSNSLIACSFSKDEKEPQDVIREFWVATYECNDNSVKWSPERQAFEPTGNVQPLDAFCIRFSYSTERTSPIGPVESETCVPIQ